MATAEAETSRDEQVPPGGSVYDGFISYSHAADDLLAPRLQAGLQRFAKPWWKRRALRIFRDESSLSANPHLWSSITDALDGSAWFVLLLSPDAAESEWVNNEVEYWLEHRNPGRIIPVLTEGDFGWSAGDVTGDAVPPALLGAFSDEPRWVDLRFAHTEEQLDLQNPAFSAAVADIASAIRGVPKDELASEEVRQHRRTVRTAWAAGAGLVALSTLAGGAALFAVDQRNEAVEQAAVAQAREITLEAEKVIALDPELGAHLALRAFGSLRDAGENSAQTESVLRTAIAADRVVHRVGGGVFAAVDPDGLVWATKDPDDPAAVVVWNVATGEQVERYARHDGADLGLGDPECPECEGASAAAFSPNGNLLAVAYENAIPAVTVWDRTTGESFDIGEHNGQFVNGPVFSPDGSLLAIAWREKQSYLHGIEVWSLDERRIIYEFDGANGAHFNADGLLSFAVDELPVSGAEVAVNIVAPVTGAVVATIPVDIGPELNFTQWSPDGTLIAVASQGAVVVLDAETGETILRAADIGRVFRPEWLPDGQHYVVGGELPPRVVSLHSGEAVIELAGLAGGSWDYDVIPGTELIAAASLLGDESVIFDVSRIGGSELGGWVAPFEDPRAVFTPDGTRALIRAGFVGGTHLTADAKDGSDRRLGEGKADSQDNTGGFVGLLLDDGRAVVRAVASGQDIYEAPTGWRIGAIDRDGQRALINNDACDQIRIVSVSGDADSVDLKTGALDAQCPYPADFSPNGQFVHLPWGGVYDARTGERVIDFLSEDPSVNYLGWRAAFTADGSELIVGGGSGRVFVFDLPALLDGETADTALIRTIDAHDSFIVALNLSPDESLISTAAQNEPARLWNRDAGDLLGEFGGLPGNNKINWASFHPTLPQLMVSTPSGEIRIHTLDTSDLLTIAAATLSREITDEECERYLRGPCTGIPVPETSR